MIEKPLHKTWELTKLNLTLTTKENESGKKWSLQFLVFRVITYSCEKTLSSRILKDGVCESIFIEVSFGTPFISTFAKISSLGIRGDVLLSARISHRKGVSNQSKLLYLMSRSIFDACGFWMF